MAHLDNPKWRLVAQGGASHLQYSYLFIPQQRRLLSRQSMADTTGEAAAVPPSVPAVSQPYSVLAQPQTNSTQLSGHPASPASLRGASRPQLLSDSLVACLHRQNERCGARRAHSLFKILVAHLDEAVNLQVPQG